MAYLGSIMFFYVEDCFFLIQSEPTYSQRCLELCNDIQRVNKSRINETYKNDRELITFIGNLTNHCKIDKCKENTEEIDKCVYDTFATVKWLEFVQTVMFTIGE